MGLYKVLLVDDEIASIKYLRSLISGYLPVFEVAAEAYSGQEAFECLCAKPVDLLITDARMPGMDGIELAQKAHERFPALHIVVVSGYADFEYAKGALSAGVNEYLLKPLDIARAVCILGGIAEKLKQAYRRKRLDVLAALALGKPVSAADIQGLFACARYHVALIRFGNLPMPRSARLLMEERRKPPPFEDGLLAIPGRDEREWIAVVEPGAQLESLERMLPANGEKDALTLTRTESPRELAQLREAVLILTRTMDDWLVMGQSQALIAPIRDKPPAPHLPLSELRKIDFALSSGNLGLLKEALFSWTVEWEALRLPQRAVESALYQIMERAASQTPALAGARLQIKDEIDELFLYAVSAGELMSGFWDVVFARVPAFQQMPVEAKRLFEDIRGYVKGNCAEPINMQSACVQFGISQTYLSRLFRKFEGMTFNEYLTGCRMEAAKRMIREQPQAKLRDVAGFVGYEDPSYFSKVFRQREGMTPQQFAAACQAELS